MMHTSQAAIAAAMPRAVLAAPRADTGSPAAVITQLNAAFAEFKATNDAQLKAKADDVVVSDKLAKINAALDGFQTALNDLAAKAAAGAAGGSVIGDLPANPEYVGAFKAHMRKGDVQAALNSGTAAEGGYLAPVEWDRTLTGKLKELSPIRAHARVISIQSGGFSRNYTDRAIGSGWVGEQATRPATSTPAFGQQVFATGELYANPSITQINLDDAALDLEQWLAAEVETEFARQEGIAFLSGNGTNKPFGILTYVTGAANAAKHPWGAIKLVNSGAAAAVTADGLLSLIYDLPQAYRAGANFFLNRLTQGAIRKLKDGQGNYLWQPQAAAGQPATLMGESVVELADMPDIAAGAVPILYGDMARTYLVVDRVGIRVLRDPYTNKPFVHFYTTKRVGGGVDNPEPMRGMTIAA